MTEHARHFTWRPATYRICNHFNGMAADDEMAPVQLAQSRSSLLRSRPPTRPPVPFNPSPRNVPLGCAGPLYYDNVTLNNAR